MIELYTDGSCTGKQGGWGVAVVNSKRAKEVDNYQPKVLYGWSQSTTCNQMELSAVIFGLTSIKYPENVKVYSDSKYVITGMNEWMYGWKKRNWVRNGKPIPNDSLWQALDFTRNFHKCVQFIWIKGHNGHKYNELADHLAKTARQTQSTWYNDLEKRNF